MKVILFISNSNPFLNDIYLLFLLINLVFQINIKFHILLSKLSIKYLYSLISILYHSIALLIVFHF